MTKGQVHFSSSVKVAVYVAQSSQAYSQQLLPSESQVSQAQSARWSGRKGESHWEWGNCNRKLPTVSTLPLGLCLVIGWGPTVQFPICRTQPTEVTNLGQPLKVSSCQITSFFFPCQGTRSRNMAWSHSGEFQPSLGHRKGGIWTHTRTHTHQSYSEPARALSRALGRQVLCGRPVLRVFLADLLAMLLGADSSVRGGCSCC